MHRATQKMGTSNGKNEKHELVKILDLMLIRKKSLNTYFNEIITKNIVAKICVKFNN